MGNGDTKRDTAKIFEANQRLVSKILDYLLTASGYTGYFSGRVRDGRIELVKFEHTHLVDGHGKMGSADLRHDPDRL